MPLGKRFQERCASAGTARRMLQRRYTWSTSMPHKLPNPPPGFDELSVEEKIDYVQSLWDRIAANAEAVPVPDWHLKIINERVSRARAEPNAGRPWDEVREELRAKLRQRKQRG
jgi:putative addiction module component (TIGR02574 family)